MEWVKLEHVYISGIGLVLPHVEDVVKPPDYSEIYPGRSARRLSKLIKMSSYAAMNALKMAGDINPSAIITGTGMGCLYDTEVFLRELIEREEGVLSPTKFIQSTHNTTSAQIGFLKTCHGYNSTYSQRGHSFENALMDAIIKIKNGCDFVLVGGGDEHTEVMEDILKRMGHRQEEMGEGAGYCVLQSHKNEKCFCKIDEFSTCYTADEKRVVTDWDDLIDGMDAIIIGINDRKLSEEAVSSISKIDDKIPIVNYKQLTNEFKSSHALGLMLAAMQLKDNHPFGTELDDARSVLIYNNYMGHYHSTIKLSRV